MKHIFSSVKTTSIFMKYLIFGIIVGSTLLMFAEINVSAQKKKAGQKTSEAAAPPAIPVEEPAKPEPIKTYKTKICVSMPKTNLAPAETAAESLRNSLVQYLSGPVAEIVSLDAMVAVQQQAEAAEKDCGFYLTASMMQKKKGGGEGIGGLLKTGAGAAPLFNDIGSGKIAQTVSSTATRSGTKLGTAGDLALTIKAKDEVTFEYSLNNVQTGAAAATGKIKAKAGKDGEDILSPMLEQSVNAVLTAALKQ